MPPIEASELKSFSSACLEVAKELIKLSSQGYDCLLIPCRGAFPVLVGAVEALKLIDGGKELLARFFAPYPHPILREYHRKNGDFKILMLPITAHVTIPEEYRQKYDFKEPIDAVESSVRLWATNLALSFLKEADERNEDDYFNFYTKLLNLTGRKELEKLYRNFPKCNNLIYLDTVISGLASHTILKGFKDANYNPYTIFVVDNYGAKLKPKYSWIFRSLESNGLATKILVSKLLAEDTNSALLGVSATVYPTIIMASWKKIKPCGAVEWHPAIGKHLEAFTQFRTCLRKSLEGKDFTSEAEKLNESLNSIKGEEIPQLGLRMERMEETRGGVVNIYLTPKDSNLVE
jgi:hypothetical protein